MSRWSKLQRQIYLVIDPEINLQIHCVVYPPTHKPHCCCCCPDSPRYWITLDKEIIWDYPKDFPERMSQTKTVEFENGNKISYDVGYPGVTDVSDISCLIKEYLDTPKSELLTKKFDADKWGLADILRAADRRIGAAKRKSLRDKFTGPAAKVLEKGSKGKPAYGV